MIEKDILSILQTAAIAAVAGSQMPNLPIKAVGRTFIPPNDQKYLELVRITNNVLGEFWGKSKTYRGMFRLILHWPLDDAGAYPPITVLQSIVSYFESRVSLDLGNISVKITENPDFQGEIEASPERLYPVSIRYQCFVS